MFCKKEKSFLLRYWYFAKLPKYNILEICEGKIYKKLSQKIHIKHIKCFIVSIWP